MAMTSSSRVTSTRMATAFFPQAAAASATSSSRRAVSSTLAPWSTNILAITGPRPVLAPVMIAVLPSRRPVMAGPLR